MRRLCRWCAWADCLIPVLCKHAINGRSTDAQTRCRQARTEVGSLKRVHDHLAPNSLQVANFPGSVGDNQPALRVAIRHALVVTHGEIVGLSSRLASLLLRLSRRGSARPRGHDAPANLSPYAACDRARSLLGFSDLIAREGTMDLLCVLENCLPAALIGAALAVVLLAGGKARRAD